MDSFRKSNSTGLGLLLIIIGTVLIAINLHWIPFAIRSWLISWQMLLIVIGLILLVSKPDKSPGLILLFIGGFFLSIEHFTHIYNLRKFFWPSLIIFIGLMVLVKGNRGDSYRSGESLNDHNK